MHEEDYNPQVEEAYWRTSEIKEREKNNSWKTKKVDELGVMQGIFSKIKLVSTNVLIFEKNLDVGISATFEFYGITKIFHEKIRRKSVWPTSEDVWGCVNEMRTQFANIIAQELYHNS